MKTPSSHPKPYLFILLLLSACILLFTCEKKARDNPWDLKNTLDPKEWAPQNLEIEPVSITDIKLLWQFGDYNIEGFKVDRKKGNREWDNAYAILEKDARSWNDTAIVPDASLTYSYRVYAFAGINSSSIQLLEFESDFPAPSELKLDRQPESDVAYRLSWNDNSKGEEGFKIDRKTGDGDWIVPFDSVSKNHTEYLDTNVFIGKSTIDVHYRVYAYYREFESNKVSTETEAFLPAPTNLQITVNSISSLSLSWQDNSAGEEGFKIDRFFNDELQAPFDSVFANVTTYTDNYVNLDGNHYSYRVYSFSGKFNSHYTVAEYLPLTVSTYPITNIAPTSATAGGNVTSDGGFYVKDRGIAYCTSINPGISGSTVPAGCGEGSFTANINGLSPNTTYHVRAYATNNLLTAYGSNVTFKTLPNLPTVTTDNVTNITSSSATGGGNITDDGGAPVTARGLAYGTSPNPTISGSTVFPGSGTVSFTANITELLPNTTYHVRAFATNIAGTAYGSNVTFKTLVHQCGTNLTFMYKGQHITYGTVLRGGLCWMDRNLGAVRVPISGTDSQGRGDLFQWGRLDDGHQNRTSGTTSTLSNTNVPGHGNFITTSISPHDWRSPQNNNLWQGENGINNPCPSGWRVPTEAELNAERQSWGSNNWSGAYASTLKWPVGRRRLSNGNLGYVGNYGYVWSSSVSGTNARGLFFDSGDAYMLSDRRAIGMSVRCVRDL